MNFHRTHNNRWVLERIQRLVSDIDKDGDGKVFHHEIAEYMAREDSALSALLKEVEVLNLRSVTSNPSRARRPYHEPWTFDLGALTLNFWP